MLLCRTGVVSRSLPILVSSRPRRFTLRFRDIVLVAGSVRSPLSRDGEVRLWFFCLQLPNPWPQAPLLVVEQREIPGGLSMSCCSRVVYVLLPFNVVHGSPFLLPSPQQLRCSGDRDLVFTRDNISSQLKVSNLFIFPRHVPYKEYNNRICRHH